MPSCWGLQPGFPEASWGHTPPSSSPVHLELVMGLTGRVALGEASVPAPHGPKALTRLQPFPLRLMATLTSAVPGKGGSWGGGVLRTAARLEHSWTSSALGLCPLLAPWPWIRGHFLGPLSQL